MKAKEVHGLSNQELEEKLNLLKEELFKLRFSHATGQLENTAQMSVCKKDIARVKTVLKQRELASDVSVKERG